MPSRSAKSRLLSEVDRYLVSLADKGCTVVSVRDYEWALGNMAEALYEGGFTLNPRKIGQAEVDWLYNRYSQTCSHNTRVTYLHMLRSFLRSAKNKRTIVIPKRVDERTVRWLTAEQASKLKASVSGISRVLVHFGLDLGMRRIEMLRLTSSSFVTGRSGRSNSVLICGKGHGMGKFRSIPWHKNTREVLDVALGLRNNAIAIAKSKNPCVSIPNSLLVYERGGKIGCYQESWVDDKLQAAGKNIGIPYLSSHDLRRTFGRTCYHANVPLLKIMRLLGHASVDQTIDYLGLHLDDLSADMRTLEAYQQSVEVGETETTGISQENDGPNRI